MRCHFLALIGVSIFVLIERIKEIRAVKKMILVNTDYITDKKLEMLGLVKERRSIENRKTLQAFKTLVGSELKAYTEMMNEARLRQSAWSRRPKNSRGCDCQYQVCLVRHNAGRRRDNCVWDSRKIYIIVSFLTKV